jgi:hypothetical protein
MPPLPTTTPYSDCIGLAETLVSFVARNGLELVPELLERMDEDKLTLHKAIAELKLGRAPSELIDMVKVAIKASKLKEPVWLTALKRREMANHVIFVLAVRRVLGRDLDAPINPRGTSYYKRFATR